MTRHCLKRRNRRLIAGALFVALLFQAMIPAGFMPATDGSLSLKICHSGFDAIQHPGGHSHAEFCPFGALPGAAPISHTVAFLPRWSMASQTDAEFALWRPQARFEPAHPPRGPPYPS